MNRSLQTVRTRASWRREAMLIGLLLVAGSLTFTACDEQMLEPDQAGSAADPVFGKKCDSPPCDKDDGGTGGVDPTDPTILFTNPIKGKLSYSLYWMDDTGAMIRVLGDADEVDVHNGDPRWSPDASKFLVTRNFYSRRTGWTEPHVWIADADGTNLYRVLETGPGSSTRWLGLDRIVFLDLSGDLFATNLDGSQVDRLTFTGDIQGLVASPDGARVLARVADGQALRLYTLACAPCAVTSQTEISGSDLGLSGQDMNVEDWAHANDRVLISVHIGWGNSDISVLDLSGPDPTLSSLIVTPVDEYNAAWSHDDTRIVFARYPSATSSREAGIVIYDLLADTEAEIATSIGPVGIDWRPTAPVE